MKTGANIRRRADGRYEARYEKARDEQGRIIYGYCYGRTYEEAEEKRAAVLQPVREMNLLILGAGSYGVEVQELAQRLGVFRKIAFLDDDLSKTQVLGPCTDFEKYVDEYPIAIPAIGDEQTRMKWLARLERAGFVLPVLIHPTAVVSQSATIGYGTVVCARATVGAGARVGKGCILESGATVDRLVYLLDGTHIGCGQVVTAKA